MEVGDYVGHHTDQINAAVSPKSVLSNPSFASGATGLRRARNDGQQEQLVNYSASKKLVTSAGYNVEGTLRKLPLCGKNTGRAYFEFPKGLEQLLGG